MVSRKQTDHNNQYKNKKIPNLIVLFLITVTGVVGAGVLVFLVYCAMTGKQPNGGIKVSDEQVTEETADVSGTEVSLRSGPEPISADDPAVLGAQTGEMTDDISGGIVEEAEADNSYKSRYSGVYERFGDDLDDPEYLAANKIYVLDSRDADDAHVTLTFGGDILFDDEYAVTAKLKENGGEISAGISPDLINMMHASDVTMVNNEFPYTYGGTPTPDKTYTFRADPPTVRYLGDMGVNAVGIANNHAFDFGETGFMDTLTTLEEAQMPYCGGGRNIKEASAPLYFVIDDVKIGIIATTQIERNDYPDTRGATDELSGVFRCMNPSRLLSVISETAPKCDYLVVFIHWGTESTPEIDWIQQDQAPKIAEAGADLIIGAHPHVLQPVGKSNGVPVVYSLGNFWFNSKELDTGLVQATLSVPSGSRATLDSLQFIPCRQVGCKTSPAVGEEHDRIISDMRAMSPGVSIDQEGYITY
ncbi:MAG: CapA family protein [Lachnospiraceae bacterium]|nr:CapA family protein [Lachnospiraceae bacterium]